MNDLVVMKDIGGKKTDYLFQEIRIQLSHKQTIYKLWLDGWILPKKNDQQFCRQWWSIHRG